MAMPANERQRVYDAYAVMQMLQPHKEKNFVQRILNPSAYPTLDLGEGNYATHKMSWADTDNGPVVFPTVIYDEKKNKLIDLGDKALEHAMKSGEFMQFQSPEEADWFSQNYKTIWDFLPQE